MKKKKSFIVSFILIILIGTGVVCKEDIYEFVDNSVVANTEDKVKTVNSKKNNNSYKIQAIPEYNGESYIVINDNKADFKESEITAKSFENYSEMDSLDRCGVAFANVSVNTMPTEKRGSIGMVKPTGWHTIKYDNVDGKYLYNRCHLIGYQLTGENANEKNLITCTRYMNTVGMLEFENKVASYVKETKNHVLYRVTPIFENNNLLATGVQMEAYSVEDKGEGINFNVFVYNVQEGIHIDYTNGDSYKE